MKTIKQFLIILIIPLLCIRCADFLVQDISEETLTLKAPYDGIITSDSSISFWWDSVEWAESYNIQVVSPDFNTISYVHVDEEIQGTLYDQELPEGNYQWTVIAKNSAYQTYSDTFNLVVEADTIATGTLGLILPDDNHQTNDNNIGFSWSNISNIEGYRIQIAQPDFSSPSNIYAEEFTQDELFFVTLPDGNYQWRVRAETASNTIVSSTRSFSIDSTPPSVPELIDPTQGDTITLPYILAWDSDSDIEIDSIYIYEDSSLNNLIVAESSTTESFSLPNLTINNDYYWRVKSFDAFENESAFSGVGMFYLE